MLVWSREDSLVGLHLSLVFLLVLQVPLVLLVPGGLVGHLYQLALSFPSDLYVHEVLFWEVLFPPREIIWILGRPPSSWGSLCPIPFSWVTRSATICYGDGILICFIPFFLSLGSLSSPPPSSGGPPPPPPGGGPLPPPEGKLNCSRHPFDDVSLPSRGLLFCPDTEGFSPFLRGFSWGPGVISWSGMLGWLFPLLFKRQNRSGVISTSSCSG